MRVAWVAVGLMGSFLGQSSSGALDRVRRFLTVSLRGRQSPTEALASLKRPCDALPPSGSQMIHNLRLEAEAVLGRPLKDLIGEDEKDLPHRVPSFVHHLCYYMLTHGKYLSLSGRRNGC